MALKKSYLTFAEGVVEHGNLTKAARDAGYAATSAHVTAQRLKEREDVKRAIKQIEARKVQGAVDRANGAVLARREVIEGLHTIASSEDAGITSASKVSAWRAIAEIEGYLGRNRDAEGIQALSGIKIEIKGSDGSSVKIDTAQAVKQLTGGTGSK